MMQIVKFKVDDREHSKIAFDIRNAVFVKEQQIDPALELDEFEHVAFHYLAYIREEAVGAARWRKTTEGVKLERFAVIKEHRGKGIGEMILKNVLEDVANESGDIYIHAQQQVVPFYEKFGFVSRGEAFEEAGILHYKMIYKG